MIGKDRRDPKVIVSNLVLPASQLPAVNRPEILHAGVEWNPSFYTLQAVFEFLGDEYSYGNCFGTRDNYDIDM